MNNGAWPTRGSQLHKTQLRSCLTFGAAAAHTRSLNFCHGKNKGGHATVLKTVVALDKPTAATPLVCPSNHLIQQLTFWGDLLFPTCRRSPSRLQTALKRPPAPAPLAAEVTKAAREAAHYVAHKAAH